MSKKRPSNNEQVRNAAYRVGVWACHLRRDGVDVTRTCGYCMSGSWESFYQKLFFPDRVLHVGRFELFRRCLRTYFGLGASFDITPMEGGLYMYARLTPLR
jgi:hypothetical protein